MGSDHTPNGEKIKERRAIQLGMRGSILERFSKEFLLAIYDITDFVIEQREKCIETRNYNELQLPLDKSIQ